MSAMVLQATLDVPAPCSSTLLEESSCGISLTLPSRHLLLSAFIGSKESFNHHNPLPGFLRDESLLKPSFIDQL